MANCLYITKFDFINHAFVACLTSCITEKLCMHIYTNAISTKISWTDTTEEKQDNVRMKSENLIVSKFMMSTNCHIL